jgi:hypothetical protein
MKKILAIFAAVLTYAGAANAQVATTNNDNANTTAVTATTSDESCYCCPKGDYCSTQAGTCALHVNVNLVKDGEYYCPMEDNVSSSSAGVCPASGKELKQMKGKCSAMNGNDKNKKSNEKKSSEGDKSEGEQTPGETGK